MKTMVMLALILAGCGGVAGVGTASQSAPLAQPGSHVCPDGEYECPTGFVCVMSVPECLIYAESAPSAPAVSRGEAHWCASVATRL